MRLNLRTKLLLFAIAIAIVPLLVAGRTMIRIAQDELKSSANEQLSVTARQLAREIDDLYERSWLAPLQLIRNAIDDERLGVEEKISLLTRGIADIPDIVALQVTVEGAALPLVVVKDDFAARLKVEALDPLEVLRVPASLVAAFGEGGEPGVQEVRQVSQTDDWLATVVLPLQIGFGAGRDLALGAHRPRPAAPLRDQPSVQPDRHRHDRRRRRAEGLRDPADRSFRLRHRRRGDPAAGLRHARSSRSSPTRGPTAR